MRFENSPPSHDLSGEHCTTIDVARELGMAVRSVQMMVDRGELEAWKTPGGHRRISRSSVDRWLTNRKLGRRSKARLGAGRQKSVLLIEDSAHYQNLVALVMRQYFPDVMLHTAADGIVGLALYGQIQPDVLLMDLLLPGFESSTLLTSLRTHPELNFSKLVILTSLTEEQRKPYEFALTNIPIAKKSEVINELPSILSPLLVSHDSVSSMINLAEAQVA